MYIINDMQMALIAGGQQSAPDYSSMSREELGALKPQDIGLTDPNDPIIDALYDAGDMLGLVEYVKQLTGIDFSILIS